MWYLKSIKSCGASTAIASSYPASQYACSLTKLSANDIKSNQITFIVTSPQHKCLGEWNSSERAPDSAKKTIYIWTVHIYRLYRRQCAKNIHILSTQCTIKILSYNYTLYTACAHLHYVHYLYKYEKISNNTPSMYKKYPDDILHLKCASERHFNIQWRVTLYLMKGNKYTLK